MLTTFAAMVLMAPDAGLTFRAADGGVRALDAGVVVVEAPRDMASAAELERLKKRVADLEARNVELEKQLKSVDALSKKVDQASDDLAAFKKVVDEREEDRKEAERKALEAKQRFEAASRGLFSADQTLASGSLANVSEQLRAAEASYSGLALQYVQAARAALGNNDLGTARRMLMLAVFETQFSGRP
ncbi:MAG: hypothetical protein GQE15_36265 [Archangiaceae bacterium]|nr:hypothetical protein [Archangiaceae bacterium]